MTRHRTTAAVGRLHSVRRKMLLVRAHRNLCRICVYWILLLLFAGLIALPAHAGLADAPLLSPRATFFIPFTVDVPRPGQNQPQEVHLYVSADGGQSWHFYQRQKPDAGRFIFNAGQDGEHWFAVHTVNDPQNATPPTAYQPELKVIVDTGQPTLELEAAANPAGEIEVRWNSRDPQLDPATFRLEYKSANSPLWQPIGVPKPSGPRADFAGQHRWRPPASLNAIQIRAEVSDRCGNAASSTRDLQWAATAPGEPATVPTTPNALPQVAQTPALPAPIPTATSVPQSAASENVSPGANANQLWTPQANPLPAPPHQTDSQAWTTSPAPVEQPLATSSPTPGGESPLAAEPLAAEGESIAVTADALPPNLRTSNSRRFELDYVIETGVEIGVQRVELWYTKDHGHSWTLFGEDADRETPFLVDMEEDGVFGFKIVAQSSNGVSSGPPKSNVPADIWIRIDATRPAGRLTAARFGRGDAMGTLQIYWESHDDNPAPLPVTLLYGETLQGPWRVIADGLEAEGRYDWRVGDNVPPEIYLRLEVRDQAGNIFDDTLRDPIASNGLAPQSRIRGVRPTPTE